MYNKMQNLIKNYWKPTPIFWRKIGDSLLAVAGFIAGGGLIEFDKLKEIFSDNQLKLIIGFSIILGILGKFLTNFFKEPTKKPDNVPPQQN